MWIISKSRLREFWQSPAHGDAEGPLTAWYKHVSGIDWTQPSEAKADFAHMSFVGNCAVFNIGGNKYRLIARILYSYHKVYVLRVMTHKQYDEQLWAEDCGCHAPPPRKVSNKPRRRKG